MKIDTSGYDRKLEIPDSVSRSNCDSFEVYQVGLNHHFRRPEVKTGTSSYDRLVKMSKSKSTSSICPLQYDLGIWNYYTGCTMEFDKIHWKEATSTWPDMHSF